jgi:thioredoxin reductase (NADPH)
MESYDVVIVGAGPAGLSAGLYCAQAGLKVLALEKEGPGGQLKNIEKIENYPGFPEGIFGPELAQAMAMQSIKCGLELRIDEVVALEVYSHSKHLGAVEGEYSCKAVILSGGGKPAKLEVPGEAEFLDKGVIYCAMCDGGHFKDKVVAVAGGGDSGVSEALYMTRIASKVIILESEHELTCKSFLLKKLQENEKIQVIPRSRIEAILGEQHVEAVRLFHIETQATVELPVDGVLVHIGWSPNTDYLANVVPVDKGGHIVVDKTMETGVPGIFAVGDIRQGSARQVAAAVGDGTIASLGAIKASQMS